MRSVVEHMNDPTACLSSYPVDQHEAIALRRVRQIEALVRFAYERLLSTPDLRRHFTSRRHHCRLLALAFGSAATFVG
jgi:hypothetical protein